MALASVTGYFDGYTTTDGTSQVVTVAGLGGAPVMGIIWTYHTSGSGVTATAVHAFGLFADDLTQAGGSIFDANGQTKQVASRSHSGAHAIYTTNTAGSTVLQAAAVSAVGTSGGDGTFTLNWTTKDATSRRYGYTVWTGSDITNATVKQFQTAASAGTDPITGVGFMPDGMVMMSVGSSTAPAMIDGGFGQMSLGFTDFSSSYNVTIIGSTGGGTMVSKTKADLSFLNVGWGVDTFNDLATILSATSDGFNLSYSAADATQRYCWVLAFKGPQVSVGAFNTETSVTSADEITGLADDPVSISLLSGMRPTAVGVQADARLSWGASDGTNEFCAGYLSEDAQADSDTDRFQSVSQAVLIYDHTQTKKTSGDVSFGTKKVSVSYDVADGSNAYEIGYLVLMPAATTERHIKPQRRTLHEPAADYVW